MTQGIKALRRPAWIISGISIFKGFYVGCPFDCAFCTWECLIKFKANSERVVQGLHSWQYNSQKGLLSRITERLWLVSVRIFPQKTTYIFSLTSLFQGKKHRGQYKGTLSYGKCICIPRRMQLCSQRRKATRDAPNGKLGDETPLANFSTPVMPLDGKSAKKQ